MKNILVIALMMILPAFANAQLTFEEVITEAQKQCPNLNCNSAPVSVRKTDNFPPDTRKVLQLVASELAQAIWPDTILEGPYRLSEFNVRVEKVEVVVSNERVIGYRITYSNDAIFTDVGAKGSIRESGFVSADFNDFFRDEENIADFYETH